MTDDCARPGASSGFFFHHPLRASGGTPGRYEFNIVGDLVSLNETIRGRAASISADGLGADRLGTNQDPCVFARPLRGPIHSFCKLDALGGKHYVFGTTKNIAQSAKCEDIIIYGHLRWSEDILYRRLHVDTILVVDRTAECPVRWVRNGHKP